MLRNVAARDVFILFSESGGKYRKVILRKLISILKTLLEMFYPDSAA